MDSNVPRTPPRKSATFDDYTLAEIRRAATTGIYDIRGAGAKRKLPHFDDLLFLGASISRYPLEGYREKCGTDVVLGTRFAKKPIELKIPITIAGMSFGSLSAQAKEALGRGASMAGTSTTTGDGGMTPEERGQSKYLVYQYLPSRYGMNPDDLRRADAIEVVVGQGAKPGGGGMLLGQKISDRVANMRNLPKGIDQRSACRHPDWTGPDDLEIKILEIREITNWEKPIYIKIGASRPYYDTQLAVKAGADVIVLDVDRRWVRAEDGQLYTALSICSEDIRSRADVGSLSGPRFLEALNAAAETIAQLDGREWIRWSSRGWEDALLPEHVARSASLVRQIANAVVGSASATEHIVTDVEIDRETDLEIDLAGELVQAIGAGRDAATDEGGPIAQELRALRFADPLRTEWASVTADALYLGALDLSLMRHRIAGENAAGLAFLYLGKQRADLLKQSGEITPRFRREIVAKTFMTSYALERLAPAVSWELFEFMRGRRP